jgi:hypothetical protein
MHASRALVTALLALVACGGQATGASAGDGGTGADAAPLDGSPYDGCPEGDAATGAACASTCPDPTAVVSGAACTAAVGLMCPSATEVVPCGPPDAGPASCTCQGNRWLCPGDLAGVCAGDAGTGVEAGPVGGDGG